MKYAILGAIASIFLATSSAAQDICVSFLAAQAFDAKQCRAALRVFSGVKVPCTEFLWKTFDKHKLCPKRFLNKFYDKHHKLQIDFSNEAGRRNGRLARYEFASTYSTIFFNSSLERRDPQLIKAVEKNAADIAKFIEQNKKPSSAIYVSTGLEDNYTLKAYRVISEVINSQLPPDVFLVRNPVGHYEKDYANADYIELHGLRVSFKTKSAGRCIANLDGTDLDFENRRQDGNYIQLPGMLDYIRRAKKGGCDSFIWWGESQGIGPKFIKPRARIFRINRKHIFLINKAIKELEYEFYNRH